MAEAAERARRVAMTSFNWRFPAAMQELHARAAEGVLGRVFSTGGARRRAGRRGAARLGRGQALTTRGPRSFPLRGPPRRPGPMADL